MTEPTFCEREIKEAVKQRYAEAIARPAGSCCGAAAADGLKGRMAEMAGYQAAALERLPAGAIGEAAYAQGLAAAGLGGVRVTSRLVYEKSQLAGLFASSCCGVGDAGADADALAATAAGKIWSARFEGLKPHPASVAAAVVIGPAQPADQAAVHGLLREGELPVDVERCFGDFLVARHGGQAVGCIGMEVHGAEALFRSLAVTAAYRGLGLADRLQAALVERARARGVRRAYLLTKSVEPLAARWGFVRVDRAEAPPAIQATTEFAGACCASAVAMLRDLD